MHQNLEIKKVAGQWRIWVDNGYRGSFNTKEDAEYKCKKVIQVSRLLKEPITLFLYDSV